MPRPRNSKRIWVTFLLTTWRAAWSCRLKSRLPCVCVWKRVCACMHPVTQSCSTLCDPMDCSPPGSFVHTIFQARILEWVVTSSSEGSSWSKDWTHIPCSFCTGRCILYHCATWEAQGSLYIIQNLGSELGDPLRAQPDAKAFLYKENSIGCFCCWFQRLA